MINNTFRAKLTDLVGSARISVNVNDAVAASLYPMLGADVRTAYVGAFCVGFRILAGIAVFQLILCLCLARVNLVDDAALTGKVGESKESRDASHPSPSMAQ